MDGPLTSTAVNGQRSRPTAAGCSAVIGFTSTGLGEPRQE